MPAKGRLAASAAPAAEARHLRWIDPGLCTSCRDALWL